MGIGDPAVPVAGETLLNNPVPQAVSDLQKGTDKRLIVLERAGTGSDELVRQIKWLYDNLPGGPYTYPPP